MQHGRSWREERWQPRLRSRRGSRPRPADLVPEPRRAKESGSDRSCCEVPVIVVQSNPAAAARSKQARDRRRILCSVPAERVQEEGHWRRDAQVGQVRKVAGVAAAGDRVQTSDLVAAGIAAAERSFDTDQADQNCRQEGRHPFGLGGMHEVDVSISQDLIRQTFAVLGDFQVAVRDRMD